jgi:hypothetical protein
MKTQSMRVILLLAIINLGCVSGMNRGHNGMSEDIADSKKKDVFLFEYELSEKSIILGDSVSINPAEIWLEKAWKHGEGGVVVSNPIDGFQLCFTTEDQIPENYDFTWLIGVTGDHYFRQCGRNCFVSNVTMVESELIYFVQAGIDLKAIDLTHQKVVVDSVTFLQR